MRNIYSACIYIYIYIMSLSLYIYIYILSSIYMIVGII